MQLAVITDKGTFKSSTIEYSESDYDMLCEHVVQVEKITDFVLETDTGHIVIPPALLKTAVFILEK